MSYQIINVVDEQERLMCQPKYYQALIGSQQDSHSYSYICARKIYKDMGDIMGLEKKLEENENENI
jgi:hypothetical protein